MAEETDVGELIDWTSAVLHPMTASGFMLVIRGQTPVPMRVELHPAPPGIVAYDYWPIEVRGFRDDVSSEVVTDYTIEKPEDEIPHGTVGFVLIGATMQASFPPKSDDDTTDAESSY
jgi:hypothetical protein